MDFAAIRSIPRQIGRDGDARFNHQQLGKLLRGFGTRFNLPDGIKIESRRSFKMKTRLIARPSCLV